MPGQGSLSLVPACRTAALTLADLMEHPPPSSDGAPSLLHREPYIVTEIRKGTTLNYRCRQFDSIDIAEGLRVQRVNVMLGEAEIVAQVRVGADVVSARCRCRRCVPFSLDEAPRLVFGGLRLQVQCGVVPFIPSYGDEQLLVPRLSEQRLYPSYNAYPSYALSTHCAFVGS